MMQLNVRFKNILEEDKEHIRKDAISKLEDLNHFFDSSLPEGALTGECIIEDTKQDPTFRVHVTITLKQGREHTFDTITHGDSVEAVINEARNTLRGQISKFKEKEA